MEEHETSETAEFSLRKLSRRGWAYGVQSGIYELGSAEEGVFFTLAETRLGWRLIHIRSTPDEAARQKEMADALGLWAHRERLRGVCVPTRRELISILQAAWQRDPPMR